MEEVNQTPAQPEPQKEGMKKYSTSFFEFLKIVVIAAIIVLPIRYFIFQPFIVKGESMQPNFQSGDYLIVDEISYRFSNPQRGDVVVLKYPLDASQRFIKRVIGLPGETVTIKSNVVTVTTAAGKSITLNEKYIPSSFLTLGDRTWTLNNDEYFVMGDNRQFSYDSRSWGILPKKDLIGKAIFRLFPVSTISYISGTTY